MGDDIWFTSHARPDRSYSIVETNGWRRAGRYGVSGRFVQRGTGTEPAPHLTCINLLLQIEEGPVQTAHDGVELPVSVEVGDADAAGEENVEEGAGNSIGF